MRVPASPGGTHKHVLSERLERKRITVLGLSSSLLTQRDRPATAAAPRPQNPLLDLGLNRMCQEIMLKTNFALSLFLYTFLVWLKSGLSCDQRNKTRIFQFALCTFETECVWHTFDALMKRCKSSDCFFINSVDQFMMLWNKSIKVLPQKIIHACGDKIFTCVILYRGWEKSMKSKVGDWNAGGWNFIILSFYIPRHLKAIYIYRSHDSTALVSAILELQWFHTPVCVKWRFVGWLRAQLFLKKHLY